MLDSCFTNANQLLNVSEYITCKKKLLKVLYLLFDAFKITRYHSKRNYLRNYVNESLPKVLITLVSDKYMSENIMTNYIKREHFSLELKVFYYSCLLILLNTNKYDIISY